MAWSQEHKIKTRQKILNSAAQLFTQNGFDHVGINDVMRHAGLTRGAFYTHFSSKAELYAESIVAAAMEIGHRTDPDHPDVPPLESIIKTYLSMEHRKGETLRCPLAFLTTDMTQRDEQVRNAYTRVFKGFVNNLGKHLEQQNGYADTQKSMQQAVMMIGGLAISRALNDDTLASELLDSCHAALTTQSN
ncbi:TetR/AcrR family transcriptional regulator [Neptunomonas antarctica]|uniref:Transcriptional regulator, TetR family n=1 Tax=Neptunomonas antarctica TaxID=619304 RepID=A0A1N7N8D9_9GAMM|nr:TetR/AcrR family transcriptional regulator [Neptunomonas antarctica]SIS94615.1 transcriptional regulator, TetR family [Neptunomonas antarctica]